MGQALPGPPLDPPLGVTQQHDHRHHVCASCSIVAVLVSSGKQHNFLNATVFPRLGNRVVDAAKSSYFLEKVVAAAKFPKTPGL